jgi:NAD(P)-dependent dehydrogenase (short-subunit alcohol dehydrogenase family)
MRRSNRPPKRPESSEVSDAAVNLEGKVAIVTGAGRGIGRAEAIELAHAGASVVVNDLGVAASDGVAVDDGGDETPARAVVDEILVGGGRAVADFGDVSHWDDASRLVSTALDTFGRLDILVNNAGILPPARIIPDMEVGELDRILRVHVRGHFCTTILATRHWRDISRKGGAPVDARIVNTTSGAYLVGSPMRVDYAAAKAAIAVLTLATARGCASFGVRANAISPVAATRMSGAATQRAFPGESEDHDPTSVFNISPIVVALAGPAGAAISGQIFNVADRKLSLIGPSPVVAEFETTETWSPEEVSRQLDAYFEAPRLESGWAIEDDARKLLKGVTSIQ